MDVQLQFRGRINSRLDLSFPIQPLGFFFRQNVSHFNVLKWRYVQKCTQQQIWQKWQNFANNNLEANANEKTRGPPCKAGDFGEFGESGKNGILVKIADNNLEANANEKARGPPCKAGEFGEFGESGKNGKLVKFGLYI